MSAHIPKNFEQWMHCITVECGIPLTPEFVAQRLSIWRNMESEETIRFSRLYGDQHLKLVVGWFERVAKELNSSQ